MGVRPVLGLWLILNYVTFLFPSLKELFSETIFSVSIKLSHPRASWASRAVANLTWRKNPPPTPRLWCQRIFLSVCDKFWTQLSQDWRNRMGWNFFRISAIFGITFLAWNNYPDLHHSQRVMKFATQIFPLRDYQVIFHRASDHKLGFMILTNKYCLVCHAIICSE